MLYHNAFLALILVLLLIYVTIIALNKLPKLYKFSKITNDKLIIVERLWLDSKRQAVIIKRDEKQHLIIIGPNSETLIESF